MQMQSTPWKDPNRDGHFVCRDVVLVLFANDSSALTDLSDLPSFKDDKHGASKAKKERTSMLSKLLVSGVGKQRKLVLS